jgi:hypothetical protein
MKRLVRRTVVHLLSTPLKAQFPQCLVERHKYDDPQPLSPLTHFIGSLWAKLAINDPTLTPLADGFRITNTYPVSSSLAFKSYKLADVTTPQIIQNVRREFPVGPDWDYLY